MTWLTRMIARCRPSLWRKRAQALWYWVGEGLPLSQAALLAYFVLMPLAGGADTTSSTLSNDMLSAYIADKTLMVAEKQVKMAQLGDPARLPSKMSPSFQYTTYDRLALPQSTLTEGVTPASTQMSISTVSATVEQWGQVVVITDVANLTIKHNVFQKAVELLALAAAETRDREVQEVLLAGTNAQYAGTSNTTRGNLAAGDVITTGTIRTTVANLRNNGARPYSGDLLVGVIDPSVEQDLTSDATFVAAAQYSKVQLLLNGEIGTWMGVRWIRSNFLYTFTGAASATAADVSAAGSIDANTTVYTVTTRVDATTGFENGGTQEATTTVANDGLNTHAVRVTMPSTTGYTYNVYAGTVSGTLYQVSTGNAAGATYDITTVPTSGTQHPAIAATGVTTHVVWVMGKEAFAVVTLDGMSLQTYAVRATASDSDKLAQRHSAGWKLMFKAVICNNNYLRRIECTSNY